MNIIESIPQQGGNDIPTLPNDDKKRKKKLPLTKHEALTLFWQKGIYVDEATGELRTSTNHKVCDKWDLYGYNRHFTFACYKKYELGRLDETELTRLKESKEAFFRMHPQLEEASLFHKKRKVKGEKILSVDELRVQEKHWMEMWKECKSELKQLREDLKNEMDDGVRAEMEEDVRGLKKRKGDWAKLLGLNASDDVPI